MKHRVTALQEQSVLGKGGFKSYSPCNLKAISVKGYLESIS